MNNLEQSEVAQEDQVLTIPKGYFVTGCDLDSNLPTCKICSEKDAFDEKTIEVPYALAYYLRTHFNGSYKMRELIINQTKRSMQNQFKELLGIEEV